VRIALGAKSVDILEMVLRQGALLVGAGLIPGMALGYAAGRAIEALLVGVKPSDPATFLSVGSLCVLMATLGVLSPALRALRTDPISAIRAE